MINKRFFKTKNEVEVTFEVSLPDAGEGVSVVCDALDWAPVPMRRTKDTWKAKVRLPVDRSVQFRYLASGGRWLNDDRADGYMVDGHGNENSLVDTHRP